MWIILKIDNQLFKMINTDVCACFQNKNGELGFEHGNYHHTIPTTDIADVQDILDYIVYCLKQKKYICEIPSAEYNIWRSRFIRKKDLNKIIEEVNKAPVMPIPREGNDYITTYHGIPIEEFQKAYEENTLYEKYKEIIDKWKNYNNISIRIPHCGHKISNEEREEAIKRAVEKAYLFDEENKKEEQPIKSIIKEKELCQLKELEKSVRNIIDTNITIRCPYCSSIVAEDNKDVIIKNFINDSSPISCPYCEKTITKEDKIKAVEVVVEWYKNFKLTELSQEEKNYLDNYINSIPHYDE